MVDWFAGIPDPTAAATKSNAFINALVDRAQQQQDRKTQEQAGSQYASGDYTGAAKTIASMGNIGDAQKIQAAGAQANAGGIQYLAKALPIFQQIAAAHAQEGPQGQSQALTAAFDHIAPEAKQLTGVSDQVLQSLRQGFATDPQGTLTRLQAQIPTEFKSVGDSLYGIQGGNITSQTQAPKYITVNGKIVQVGGAASSPQAPAGAVPNASPPVAQDGTDPFTGLASKPAVAQIESNGSPTAVNQQSGATGLYQTMPSTLADPGFGVKPAQDGSSQEQARVGSDYLDAMGNRYGNVVDQLVAQDWGPGAADKWIKAGRHVDQLPKETRDYLLKYAIAKVSGGGGNVPSPRFASLQPAPAAQYAGAGASIQAFPQGSPGAQLADRVSPPQSQQAQGGAQVVYDGGPEWRDATPAEAKQGVRQVNTGTGQKTYEPSTMMAGAIPVDPTTVDYWAHSVAAGGTLPPLGMGAQAAALRQAILARAAQINTKQGLGGADQNALTATTKANSSTLSKQTALRSATEGFENTMLQNMNVVRSLLKKGAGTTGIPILNRLQQYARGQYAGDPDVTALNNAIDTVADENAKIRSGTLGNTPATDAMRTNIRAGLNGAMTPQQIESAFQVMEKDAANRTGALRAQEGSLRSAIRGKSDKPSIPNLQKPPPQKGGQPNAQDIVNELRRRGLVK